MWSIQPRWLVLAALAVAMVIADDDVTTSAPAEPVVTEEPRTLLDITIGERQVSSVAITWDAPEEGEVTSYRIRAQKTDSEDLIYSPSFDPPENEYLMENLMANSEYEICVLADLKGKEGKDHLKDCRNVSTIPIVRVDSMLALFAALGFIFLMILIGILCWCCAHRRARRSAEEEEEEEDEADAEPEKVAPVIYRPAYVSPPTGSPVRSSIEDNPDIPYITPPVDQLNKPNQYNPKV